MFAVIESGGKQHTVSEGDNLKIELLSAEEGSTLVFDKFLIVSTATSTNRSVSGLGIKTSGETDIS